MCKSCNGTRKNKIQAGRNAPIEIDCRSCQGSGKSEDEVMCKTCFDTGKITKVFGCTFVTEIDCPNCKKEEK